MEIAYYSEQFSRGKILDNRTCDCNASNVHSPLIIQFWAFFPEKITVLLYTSKFTMLGFTSKLFVTIPCFHISDIHSSPSWNLLNFFRAGIIQISYQKAPALNSPIQILSVIYIQIWNAVKRLELKMFFGTFMFRVSLWWFLRF